MVPQIFRLFTNKSWREGLQVLKIGKCQFVKEICKNGGLAKAHALKELSIVNNDIGSLGLRAMLDEGGFPSNLEDIRLGGNNFKAEDIIHLFDAYKGKRRPTIHCSGPLGSILEATLYWKSNTRKEQLEEEKQDETPGAHPSFSEDNEPRDFDISIEEGREQNKLQHNVEHLTRIDLNAKWLCMDDIKLLIYVLTSSEKEEGLDFSHVRDLRLGDNSLDDNLGDLAAILPKTFPALQELAIHANYIGVEGITHICNTMKGLPEIMKLHAAGDVKPFGEAGAAVIADTIPQCPKLIHLGLWQHSIGDKGATAIFSALPKCHKFEEIDVNDNGITDASMKYVADAISSCPLKKLCLAENKIGDKSIKLLADAIINSTTLRSLLLNDNEFSDTSVDCFVDIIKRSKIDELFELQNNPISRIGKQSLRDAWTEAGRKGKQNTYGNFVATRITGDHILFKLQDEF